MKNRKLTNTRRGRSKIRQAKESQPGGRKKNPGIKDLPTGRAIKGTLRIVKRGRRRVVTFRPSK